MNQPGFFMAAVLCLALAWYGDAVIHAQSPAKGGKAPETSSDESFRPQELAKLAVIVSTEQRNRQLQSDQQRLVEDMFVQTLLERGHVVVARSDIRSVLKEQAFANSGLTDGNAAAVGKLLNVPAVLVVRITEFLSENQRDAKRNPQVLMARAALGARLVSVETGGIWWQGTHSLSEVVNRKGELLMVLAKVTEKLSRAFPEKNLEKNAQKDSEKETEKTSHFDPKGIDKLALIMVGETRSRNASLDQQRLVEDKLGILLGNKGYTLVSRSDLQSVMQEKEFQQSGLTEENVSNFGKLLNIPAVMVVRITECDTESQRRSGGRSITIAMAALGARLVSVETGEVLWCRTWIAAQEVGGKLDASQVLINVAKKIGESFPNRDSAKKAAAAGPG